MPKIKKIRLAVFGKGGIGKSTFSSHLSAYWAARKLRVLQVGCDPKADSTLLLRSGPAKKTVMSHVRSGNRDFSESDVVFTGRFGVRCVEAGGPVPGVGCAGYGISLMMELFSRASVLKKYDAVVFDILGDIVCGGFSSPLRLGLASDVVILVSDEFMSYFAANNIARMVCNFSGLTGVNLAGLVLNSRNGAAPDVRRAEDFAARLNTRLLGVLPSENSFIRHGGSIVFETDPRGGFAGSIARVAAALEKPGRGPVPSPIPDEELDLFFKAGRG